jgi:hypothetical protein
VHVYICTYVYIYTERERERERERDPVRQQCMSGALHLLAASRVFGCI